MMKHKITCKQAVNYISKREEKKLSAWQRVQLWQHLTVCSLCRLFAQQNKAITKALSGFNKGDADSLLSEKDKQQIIETVLEVDGK